MQSLSQSDNFLNIQPDGSATRCTVNTAVSLLSVQVVSSGSQGLKRQNRMAISPFSVPASSKVIHLVNILLAQSEVQH
jgi:hypothetical protein